MTPPTGPKTTDQRQAKTIVDAVITELERVGVLLNLWDGIALADEGRQLIASSPVDLSALLTWNRQSCEWLIKHRPVKP